MYSRSKAVPSVTDSTFEIRVPSFMVIHERVLHHKGAGMASGERIMGTGDSASYRKHGRFQICCIHDGHAVINHWTRSDKLLELLVPKGKWLHVSNGSYKVSEPNLKSYADAYSHLATQPRVIHPPELLGKYMVLLDTFRNYWKENFAESVQEDVDREALVLGSRIRYGLTCILEGQPIPPDCEHDRLLDELHQDIDYFENA